MQAPWHIPGELPREAFAEVRRRAIFECCKWDVQVEDTSTLCPFPLVLRRDAWNDLVRLGEQLANETLRAEAEIIARRDLHETLGLPRAILRALRGGRRVADSASAVRLMRFDFHWTTEGWRISEVNSDVPGGFVEASGFSRLMAAEFPDAILEADPTSIYAEAIAHGARPGDLLALVHATAYSDDRQVMQFVARALNERGMRTALASPEHLEWRDGYAWISGPFPPERLGFIVRFFPAEWLPELPRRSQWRHFFLDGRAPMSNPGTALLTQSKRFPLLWSSLRTELDGWRSLLPETRDPRQADSHDPEWVFKPALGRVGDGIAIHGLTTMKQWKDIRRAVQKYPEHWVAQRYFQQVPLENRGERLYPCLGVYTIDNRVAGIYGRISTNGLVDFRARDIAVLVESPEVLAEAI
jgi:glutathionylspermidine synthase